MADYWANSGEAAMGRNQWKRSGGKFLFWQGSDLKLQRAAFRTAVVDGYARPIVVTSDVTEINIPVGLTCQRLHFLGQITVPTGYPVWGQGGDVVASYSINYANGTRKEVPLRNGFEVARGNLIHAATRFNPVAVQAQQALIFTKDIVREEYQVLLLSVPTEGQLVSSVTCTLKNHRSLS